MRTLPNVTVGLFLVALFSAILVGPAPATASPADPRALSSDAVVLVENVGQYPPDMSFAFLNGPGRTFLADDAIWVMVTSPVGDDGMVGGTRLRIAFEGASATPDLEPYGELPARVSFLRGADPSAWRADVPVWAAVRYRDIYPGIDLVFGEGAGAAWSWRLESRTGRIAPPMALTIDGAERVSVENAALIVETREGVLTLPLPRGATADARVSRTSAGAFTLPLSLDPRPATSGSAAAPEGGAADLVYSTFLGGSGFDTGFAVQVDGSGDAYLAGRTLSADFPTKGSPGPFDPTYAETDAFVAKLRPGGAGANDLLYATYLGGTGVDSAYALAVDGNGNAYVTGSANSTDFPVTAGAHDTTCGASDDCVDFNDAFLAVLNPGGSGLLYATYAGGSNNDLAYGISLSGSVAYLAGETSSGDFPTTGSGYDRTCGTNGDCDTASNVPYSDAFLLKFDRNLSGAASLVYGTFVGGADTDVANAVVVSGSQATLAGHTYSSNFPGGGFAGETDAFATRIDTAVSGGSGLLFSRLTGGTAYDEAKAVALDGSGNALVAGETRSADFPAPQGAYRGGAKDAFLARITPSGGINYSSCIGGSNRDEARSVAVGEDGGVSLAGYTRSLDFPTTPSAFDLALSGAGDMFAARLDLTQSPALTYGAYLGGSVDDEAFAIDLAANGNAYISGWTGGGGYPTTANAFDTSFNGAARDVTLSVLTLQPTGSLQITKVVDWNGVTPPATQGFNICITGPSHPGGDCKDFTYPDGLVRAWTNLIPGQYSLTETDPGSRWQVEIAGSPALVLGDGSVAAASVTNTRLPDKPPVPPVVAIAAAGADAVLTWDPVAEDVDSGELVVVRYEVWLSEMPYFTPSGPPDAEVMAPLTSFTHPGALAVTSTNHYYVIRAVSDAGLSSGDSNRTGEFGFDLVKGS